jgi:hypothetical protein
MDFCMYGSAEFGALMTAAGVAASGASAAVLSTSWLVSRMLTSINTGQPQHLLLLLLLLPLLLCAMLWMAAPSGCCFQPGWLLLCNTHWVCSSSQRWHNLC